MGNPKDADNSLTGTVLAMSRGDGLYQGWGGGELDICLGDTQPRSPFSSVQTPRHISQTQLSTWYCNTPGISASARLGEKVGWGLPRQSRRRIVIIVIATSWGRPRVKKEIVIIARKSGSAIRPSLAPSRLFGFPHRSSITFNSESHVQNKMSLFFWLICAKFVYNHLPPLGSFHLLLLLQLLSCLFPQQQLEIPCSYYVVSVLSNFLPPVSP